MHRILCIPRGDHLHISEPCTRARIHWYILTMFHPIDDSFIFIFYFHVPRPGKIHHSVTPAFDRSNSSSTCVCFFCHLSQFQRFEYEPREVLFVDISGSVTAQIFSSSFQRQLREEEKKMFKLFFCFLNCNCLVYFCGFFFTQWKKSCVMMEAFVNHVAVTQPLLSGKEKRARKRGQGNARVKVLSSYLSTPHTVFLVFFNDPK